jgi:hypothetical protein
MVRKLTLAAAATALTALPLAGHAAPSPQRAAAEMSGQNEELAGLLWQYIIFPAVIAAVLVLLTGGSDDESPESP